MSLTPDQIKIIKATVPVVQEHGPAVTALFYRDLLDEVPSLRNIFNHANQVQGHQSTALAGALYAYAANIEDLAPLKDAVEKIDQKHASLHVTPDQYDVVGKYLLRAMAGVLGSAFTPEVHDAWAVAYKQLADVMINRERQLYAESDGWTTWRDFTIWKKIPESENVTSFYLRPVDGRLLPSFKPGQYISIQTDVPDLKYLQSRQYSLSGRPNTDFYRISVKREAGLAKGSPEAAAHPGYVSTILHTEKNEGDILQVSHPYGEFVLDVDMDGTAPLVFLSAGIGLTPLVSMLETIVARRYRGPVGFLHGTRSARLDAFAKHVRDIAKEHSNINVKIFDANPSETDKLGEDYDVVGRLEVGKLEEKEDLHLDDGSAMYYVCGPQAFMLDVHGALKRRGIEELRIRLELFGTGAIPKA